MPTAAYTMVQCSVVQCSTVKDERGERREGGREGREISTSDRVRNERVGEECARLWPLTLTPTLATHHAHEVTYRP